MLAKFRIKQTITINDKAYALAVWVNDSVNWYLSDTSYLGGCPIENWVDIPRTIDENENVFAFALIRAEDKHKLKQDDIVELWDEYVDIIDSFKLSFPKIVAFVKCYPGKLPVGLVVSNRKNQKWILQNYFHTAGPGGCELLEKMAKENIFEYALEPIGHDEKPQKGEKLRIEMPTTSLGLK